MRNENETFRSKHRCSYRSGTDRIPCRSEVSEYRKDAAIKGWNVDMNQTNWIVTFLVIGFLVYVIMRGELPKYRAIVGV